MKTNVKKLVPALIVLVVLIAVFWGVSVKSYPLAACVHAGRRRR